MTTISDIHSRILADYKKLNEEHEKQKKEHKENIYRKYPRLQQIDDEISMLAVTSARRVLEEKISPEKATELMRESAEKLKKERQAILSENNETEDDVIYECDLCKDKGVLKMAENAPAM